VAPVITVTVRRPGTSALPGPEAARDKDSVTPVAPVVSGVQALLAQRAAPGTRRH
jgi:hypothetical protein